MDETGDFWKGLPDVSLTENGKRCSGGKQSKQRNIWANFVNAAGGKEDPVIISHAVEHRCFKHLKDRKRSYRRYYFSNKAWMTNNIMDDILRLLNQRLQRRQRNIVLFLDNAPCHSTNHLKVLAQKKPCKRRSHLPAEWSQAGNVNTKRALYIMFAAKSMDPVMQGRLSNLSIS